MENFHAEWAACLLEGIEDNCSPEIKHACLERCAGLHYRVNDMDQLLEKYVGDLDRFIDFLHREYGWIVRVDRENKRLLVDENKDYCVCPITTALQGKVSPALCDCSAHYARKMFSKVLEREVFAKVQRSFLRDGLSCVYEISIAE
ncbi:hypothetical protein HNQ56_000158 [Anaerotaenia torta]|uniref:hypothetical protein n=1 Tax=Anaerotaenia torta TaxID=433293 RepID=UPI003D22A889